MKTNKIKPNQNPIEIYKNLVSSVNKFISLFNSFEDLQVFADNASAKAGKLKVGDKYRKATGELMIVF